MRAFFKPKHILDSRQFKDRRFLEPFFHRVKTIKERILRREVMETWKGRGVFGWFFETSTRTRVSFERAAQLIGAGTVFIENPGDTSSIFKGETLEHSLVALQDSFDAIVIRHKEDFVLHRLIAEARIPFRIPIINAGDGKNQHPTQALLDVYTIWEKFGRLDNLKIGFVGDLLQGRTVKSLIFLLSHFRGNEFYLVSHKLLRLPDDQKAWAVEKGARIHETDRLDPVLPLVDALYVVRTQWERATGRLRSSLMAAGKELQITSGRANRMREYAAIMHPMPINRTKSNGLSEITPDVDENFRALFIPQSNNGPPMRAALLEIGFRGPDDELWQLIGDPPLVLGRKDR